MARDIEEFLRRAAERRAQQKSQQPPPAQAQSPDPPRRTISQPLSVQEESRDFVEQVEVVRVGPEHESVSDHVRSHIDTHDISEHVEHLGERIQNVDSKAQQRIERKFDRNLGGGLEELETVTDDGAFGEQSEKASGVTSEVLALFRSPTGIRQAVLISEILKRPSFDD